MNWNALKSYKCPKCGFDLCSNFSTEVNECSSGDCDFRISPEKLDQIVSRRPKMYVEPDRTGWE